MIRISSPGFRGWHVNTAIEDTTSDYVLNVASTSYIENISNGELTLYGFIVGARAGTINYVSYTAQTMHGGTFGIYNLGSTTFGGYAKSAVYYVDTSTWTVKAFTTVNELTASAKGNYTFVGWYKTSAPTSETSEADESGLTYTFTEDDWGKEMVFYAVYKPTKTTANVNLYTLTGTEGSATYSPSSVGGLISSIKIGDVTISTSSLGYGQYSFDGYYIGSGDNGYTVTFAPSTYYEIEKLVKDSDGAKTEVIATSTTWIPWGAGVDENPLAAYFWGQEITVSFDKNENQIISSEYYNGGGTDITLPDSITVRYGLEILPRSYNFSTYAIEYVKHLGFDKTSTNTTAALVRDDDSYKADSTFSFIINSTNLTISNKAATLYCIWGTVPVWVSSYNSIGEEISDVDLKRGYNDLVSAFNAVNGETSVNKATVIVLAAEVTLTTNIEVVKETTLTAKDDSNKIVLGATGDVYGGAFINSASFTVENITITGRTDNVSGLFVTTSAFTMNSVTITGVTATNVIHASGSAAIVNVSNSTFIGDENSTIGTAGNNDSVINVLNGAAANITNSSFVGLTIIGRAMFNINGSTMNVYGCTIGGDQDQGLNNTYVNHNIENAEDGEYGIFYNSLGTLIINSYANGTDADTNDDIVTTIYTNGTRAVFSDGTGATNNVDAIIDLEHVSA